MTRDPERSEVAAARRDPEPVASADAAWEAPTLPLCRCGHRDEDHGNADPECSLCGCVAYVAAIRGTEAGLDVERLARALETQHQWFLEQPESFDTTALIAAAIAHAYAADSEPS